MMKSYSLGSFKLFAFVTLFVLAAVFLWGCGPSYGSRTRTSVGVGVNATYSELNDWGYWRVHAQFGDVWCPDVDRGWAPFTYGNWVWSDQGWLWTSYEPYGWLVFHYGNWYYDTDIGWFWIPGYSWSPAPVQWYEYDDYICWAPRPPRGYHWKDPWETKVTFAWTSVPKSHFLKYDVGEHRIDSRPPSKSGLKSIRRGSPDIKIVAKVTNERPEKIKVTREAVKMKNRTFYKAVLPSQQSEKIAQYKGKYKKVPNPKRDDDRDKNKDKSRGGGKPNQD